MTREGEGGLQPGRERASPLVVAIIQDGNGHRAGDEAHGSLVPDGGPDPLGLEGDPQGLRLAQGPEARDGSHPE